MSTFARVVEAGSFTAVAAALGTPKSSVSRAVLRLEEALGVRLLQRTTRKLTLTPAGERYLADVRGPIARVAEASDEVSEMGREPGGLVRVEHGAHGSWRHRRCVRRVRARPPEDSR